MVGVLAKRKEGSMRINGRRMMMAHFAGKIAEGYLRCKSISNEFDRQRYATIDIGCIPSSSAQYEIIREGLTNHVVFGTDKISFVCGEAGFFVKETINGSNVFRVWDGAQGVNHYIIGNNYLYNVNKAKTIVNGSPVAFESTENLCIFKGSSSIKIDYFAIKDGGHLIRDMYPAKEEATGLYGLWDNVERKFYTSTNGYKIIGYE